ncbi:peptidase m56 blar1 [Elizabethkingia meningoseptica]|uniref:M56 family metallopeptidase n=1 Tax=Elizabethkingia meningoseptica TaxID=238 RepID=UPI00099A00E6|nr:M56 family metallopeptidase [Elizabethkingia meningoseptica]OPB98999.1 peptidase m56 blar1 [Elizabethkingia meningoseptica]
METLLYLGKMLVCSTIMWAYYLLFLKDKTFHHYNRFYLLATIAMSIFLPLLKVEYFTIETDNRLFLLLQSFNVQEEVNTSHSFNWKSVVIYTLLCASAILVIRLLIGIFKILRMKHEYKGKEWEGIRFYFTDLHDAPFSFFKNLFWKSSIEIESDLGKQILKHEMVHIEQKHSWDKLFVEFVQAIFWFNPIFYWIKKELFLIHEYLADKKAVKQNDTKAFAQMLLASNFSGTHLPATSPFLSSNLKKRLKMITKPHYTKFSYARRVMALPVLFGISFSYLVNAKNKEIAKTNHEIAVAINALKQDTIGKSNNSNIRVQIRENNNRGSLLSKIENASANSIFKINGAAATKTEFLEFYHQNPNAQYAYNHSGTTRTGTTIFDAYDINAKNIPADVKKRFEESDKRFAESEKRFNKNNKNFKTSERNYIINGSSVRYEDLSAEEKKDVDNAMAEAKKARDYINSPEYKKMIADARIQAEEGRKAAEKAKAYLNSADYKKIMEDARKQAESARNFVNTPEYKKMIEDSKKQAEKAKEYVNSPEFRKLIEDSRKNVLNAMKLANSDMAKKVQENFKKVDFSGTFMSKEKQNKIIEDLKSSLKDKNMNDEDIQKIIENVKKNFSNQSKFSGASVEAAKTDSPYVMTVGTTTPNTYRFTTSYTSGDDDVKKGVFKISNASGTTEVYVNGERIEYDQMQNIDPKIIQTINIMKNNGKNTIIKIQTKK